MRGLLAPLVAKNAYDLDAVYTAFMNIDILIFKALYLRNYKIGNIFKLWDGAISPFIRSPVYKLAKFSLYVIWVSFMPYLAKSSSTFLFILYMIALLVSLDLLTVVCLLGGRRDFLEGLRGKLEQIDKTSF